MKQNDRFGDPTAVGRAHTKAVPDVPGGAEGMRVAAGAAADFLRRTPGYGHPLVWEVIEHLTDISITIRSSGSGAMAQAQHH